MTEPRIPALDALRAFALLCGVVLHATMSFSPPFTALGWPISDVSQSWTLHGIFHVVHSFRMMLFFLIAGFFARLLLQREGAAGFWRNRLKRIAAPLLIGWMILLPLVVATIIWAVVKKNGALPGNGKAAAMAGTGVPLAHLWFLYYLLWMYVLVFIARGLAHRFGVLGRMRATTDMLVRWLAKTNSAAMLLSIPLAACLLLTPGWIAWTGIPTPQVGLTPHPAALISFGSAFALGWMLHRQRDVLDVLGHSWQVHGLVAIALSGLTLWMLSDAAGAHSVATPLGRTLYAGCYALASWTWVLALLGIGMRYLSKPSFVWRYLADSSYWIYLVHLPLVFALQVAVMQWDVHWSMKFPLVLTVASALLLASYRFFVRHTVIGRWLNGRRYPASSRSVTIMTPINNEESK